MNSRIGRKTRQLRINEPRFRRLLRQQPLRETWEDRTSEAGIPRAREIRKETALGKRATLWDSQGTDLRRVKKPEVRGVLKILGQPTDTEENTALSRQGKEIVAEGHTQITVQAQVHRVDDVERSPSLKILAEKTEPDAALLSPNNSDGVIAEESPHSDSLDFFEAEFH